MDFIYSRETADISIDDARERNISDRDMVIVESRRGKVTVPARVTDTVPRGMVDDVPLPRWQLQLAHQQRL